MLDKAPYHIPRGIPSRLSHHWNSIPQVAVTEVIYAMQWAQLDTEIAAALRPKLTKGIRANKHKNNDGNDDDKFSLARTQSFGFFNDHTNENDNWKLLQNMVAQHWKQQISRKAPHTPSNMERGRTQSGQLHIPAWYQTNFFEPNIRCQFEKGGSVTGERTGTDQNGSVNIWVVQ